MSPLESFNVALEITGCIVVSSGGYIAIYLICLTSLGGPDPDNDDDDGKGGDDYPQLPEPDPNGRVFS